jgi:dTDP-glucose pyrophosphorylase
MLADKFSDLMSTGAIIMAGGRGSRMRESGHAEPKPLVKVGGVPLIERNLYALCRHNFNQIYIAIAADAEPLRNWLLARGTALACATGIQLNVVEETVPLGSIGAAALARDDHRDLLVVFADNLTTLDLRALVGDHQRSQVAMTMAVHMYPLQIPFGAPEIRDDQVIAFREKPSFPVLVCSGLYVLGGAAMDLLPRGESCGAPALIDRLLAAGRTVRPYKHEAAWTDVNDSQSRLAAERMLAGNPDLDLWAPSHQCERAVALVFGPRGLLLDARQTGDADSGVWDTFQRTLDSGESPALELRKLLREQLGLHEPEARMIGAFDDIDARTVRILRHYVFVVEAEDVLPARGGQSLRWFQPDELRHRADVAAVVMRSLAIWTSKLRRRNP